MIEANLDLWQIDAIKVITTNAIIKSNKTAVMGAGIAREAKDKFPGIDRTLGVMILHFGNNPHLIWSNPVIFSFPTKWHWKEKADIKLIENSAKKLVQIADAFQFKSMALPRPGCGNGGLEWEDVKLVLEPILDDRFIICHK
jgi:O-acetyl-ADP-ribose deacetylase (regulator of RNase III)